MKYRLHILTLAAAAALPGVALAQGTGNVTIYGLVDAALHHANNSGAGGASMSSMDDGVFTGSRLGFRGQEDLGGGLSAFFTLESGFEVGTGASQQGTPTADYGQALAPTRFWGRQALVGLRGRLGGVTLGRQYTLAHSMAGNFQAQGNPNSAAYGMFSTHHIARQDNMLALNTTLAGVALTASHTFGEQVGSANDSWAMSAGYKAGPAFVGAYVQNMKNLTGSETRKIVGLGGNYKVNDTFHLFGGAMRRTSEVSPQENKAWTLGVNVVLTPQVTLSVEHYNDNQTGSAALDGSRKVSWVSASYRFSRRTDVYASVVRNEVDGGYAKPAFMGTKGGQTGFDLDLRHTF